MITENELSGFLGAQERRELDGGEVVLVDGRGDLVTHGCDDGQLFLDFARESLLMCLAFFDLAAWKFPHAG